MRRETVRFRMATATMLWPPTRANVRVCRCSQPDIKPTLVSLANLRFLISRLLLETRFLRRLCGFRPCFDLKFPMWNRVLSLLLHGVTHLRGPCRDFHSPSKHPVWVLQSLLSVRWPAKPCILSTSQSDHRVRKRSVYDWWLARRWLSSGSLNILPAFLCTACASLRILWYEACSLESFTESICTCQHCAGCFVPSL